MCSEYALNMLEVGLCVSGLALMVLGAFLWDRFVAGNPFKDEETQ